MTVITQVRFPAMGNTADVSVFGNSRLVEIAQHRIDELEQRWSRFLPSSDISRLNNARGATVQVSPETIELIQYLISAQSITHGAFDPTMLPALHDLGYQSSFTQPDHMSTFASLPDWSLPLSSIRLDKRNSSINLPEGLTLDPGGLGKGLAADMVSQLLVSMGADGVCVSLGGDMRCIGQSPSGELWTLPIESPNGEIKQSASFAHGAIATSSVRAKTWSNLSGRQHHIIDPETLQPLCTSGIHAVQSTAIANEAVWAEVFSTAVLVRGAEIAFPLCEAHGIAAQITYSDGSSKESALWKEFVR